MLLSHHTLFQQKQVPHPNHTTQIKTTGWVAKPQIHKIRAQTLLYRRKHTPEQHNHWRNLTTSQMQLPTLLSHNKNQFHRQKEQQENMVFVVTSWPLQAAKLTLICQSPQDWWAINNATYDTSIILFITSNTRCQTDKRIWGLKLKSPVSKDESSHMIFWPAKMSGLKRFASWKRYMIVCSWLTQNNDRFLSNSGDQKINSFQRSVL